MSKRIRMDDSYVAVCMAEFEKHLRGAKCAEGKLTFTKSFTVDGRATLYYTPVAWQKMCALLKAFDKEVAWHGVCERVDGEETAYLVSDIVVYPQTVSGTTVEMDTGAYAMWLMENDEDERFTHLRMQGHSHVNMGTTPSSVDLTHQQEILDQLGDDDFYVFVIYNKKMEYNVKIYDLRDNVLYENADTDIKLWGADFDMDAFVAEAKDLVKDRIYQPPKPTVPATTGSQYPSYYESGYYNGPRPYQSYRQYDPTGTKKAGKDKPKGKANAGKSQYSLYDDDADAYYDRYGGYTYYD